MIIPATSIEDGYKKDELIKYAESLKCKTLYSEKHGGMVIDTSNTKTEKLINVYQFYYNVCVLFSIS